MPWSAWEDSSSPWAPGWSSVVWGSSSTLSQTPDIDMHWSYSTLRWLQSSGSTWVTNSDQFSRNGWEFADKFKTLTLLQENRKSNVNRAQVQIQVGSRGEAQKLTWAIQYFWFWFWWGWEAHQKLSSETHNSKAKVIWKSFELDPNASQACYYLQSFCLS